MCIRDRFYVGTPFIPKEILTQEEVLDQEILEKWLSDKRGSKVIFAMPKRDVYKRQGVYLGNYEMEVTLDE